MDPTWRPIAEARQDGTMYVVRGTTDQGTRHDGTRPYIAWWTPATEFQDAVWVRTHDNPGHRPQPKRVCWPDEYLCEVPT